MRSTKRLAALMVVVALVAVACTSGGNSDDNSGGVKTGGHLILGTLSNIDTLNPFVTFQQNSYSTFEYIYPQLVQYDLKTLEFVPDFARSVGFGPVFFPPSGALCKEASADCQVHSKLSAAS